MANAAAGKKNRPIYIDREYGTGSITHQTRYVKALENKGYTVVYVAGEVPLLRKPGTSYLLEGKEYRCTRTGFLEWLERVEKEMANGDAPL